MFDVNVATVLIVSLLVLVCLGVHIAIALGMTSALGIYLVTGGNFTVVQKMLASTAYEALRDYVFAVIPLFMLMGEFIGKSGAITDVYRGINRGLRRIPGRLAVATVLGGAVGAVVGNRVATPENRAVGTIIGAAAGALIGNRIGRKLDEADRGCIGHALEVGKQGQLVTWTNESTGVRYEMALGADRKRTDAACREFTLLAVAGQGASSQRGIACQSQAGLWQLAG